MKKILIVIMFITLFSSIRLSAYEDCGHDDYTSITPLNENVLLLNQIDTITKNKHAKEVTKPKFFGWRIKYIVFEEPATYIGKPLFSKSNASSNDIKFSFNFKETVEKKASFNVSDSLVFKGSGKAKIDLSLANELNLKYTSEEMTSVTETVQYDIIVPKNKKVTMYTMGEGKLSSGCSANYFFFIRTKFGYWEVLEIDTVYYKIVEEEIWRK